MVFAVMRAARVPKMFLMFRDRVGWWYIGVDVVWQIAPFTCNYQQCALMQPWTHQRIHLSHETAQPAVETEKIYGLISVVSSMRRNFSTLTHSYVLIR